VVPWEVYQEEDVIIRHLLHFDSIYGTDKHFQRLCFYQNFSWCEWCILGQMQEFVMANESLSSEAWKRVMKPSSIKCKNIEGIKLRDINNQSVCLQGPSRLRIGQELDFDIPLPGNLGVLSLVGEVTKVVSMKEDAQKISLYYIEIGPIDDVNRKILHAYTEYLERKKVIDNAFTKLKTYKRYLILLTERSPSRYFH
jgi:hypothetical protein